MPRTKTAVLEAEQVSAAASAMLKNSDPVEAVCETMANQVSQADQDAQAAKDAQAAQDDQQDVDDLDYKILELTKKEMILKDMLAENQSKLKEIKEEKLNAMKRQRKPYNDLVQRFFTIM